MTRLWNDMVGVSLAGRYALDECLSPSGGDAWYSTRLENGNKAAVRVMPEDGERLALWREALAVEHPNLVRMFDAGRAQVNSTPLIYAVSEFPDDFLASVIQERPLAPAEARDVLRAAAGAIKYLHKRGLVHGAVDPAHVMAFGDSIKLQSDTWELPTQGGRRRAGPYDAPEGSRGVIGPASDIWSLAVMLHEVLTQQRPNLERDSEFRYLAEPFATLLRRSLVRAPEARWTVEDIERHLHPGGGAQGVEKVAPVARAGVPESRPAPALPPPPPAGSPVANPRSPIPMWWVPVAGVIAAAGLGMVFLRYPQRSEPAPAAQTAVQPVVSLPRTEYASASRQPSRPEPPARGQDRWRVIAYTYAQRPAAEKKAKEINAKLPHFRAEVFAPASEHGPFLISLGGRMTRTEALQWQQRARANGFPRDTFVRNFVK